MFKKIKDSKWLYVVLSILMSIILWSYVVKDLNEAQTKTIREVPVTFTGVDVLETRGLIISGGESQTKNIKVTAKLDVLNKISRDVIALRIDVSKITEPGKYPLLAQPSFLYTVGSATFGNDPSELYVEITVSKNETKDIPVKAELDGGLAEGYKLGDISVTPATISISGQQELVDQVVYAKVVLSMDNMNETYTGDLPFEFIGTDGEKLTGLDITSSVDTVHVTYPIVKTVTVPLAVGVVYGGGITAENAEKYVDIEITPKTISVSGEDAALANLNQIYIGQIDLSKIITTEPFTFNVDVGQELENESGITEATVKVTIKGLITKEFDVDNILLINKPEGYTAEPVTQSRTVMVRGPEEAVNAIFKSQLRIVVDVAAGIPSAAVGRFDIPAKVYLDGSSDVGVVGTYNISVSLSK